MSGGVAIAGVGETFARADGRTVGEMVVDAVHRALADAGIDPAEVDGIATEAFFTVHDAPPDQVAAALGVRDRTFTAHLSQAGAGIVGSPQLARMAIEGGQASVVISYYGLKLSDSSAYAPHAEEPLKAAFEMPFGYFGQPVYFAAIAQLYRERYGLTDEQLGSVAVAARDHALRTPGALLQHPLDLEGYLAAPMVSRPLRGPDCCLVNDGAAAFVMVSTERARDLRQPPVVVAGTGFGTKPQPYVGYFSQAEDLLETAAVRSAPRAFAQAGLGPADVDVAEVYDCFTIASILAVEDLGLVPKGEGAAFFAEGHSGPGGRLPVNTHGGLLSHSYLVGAGHVVEAVRQLRGERGEAQVPGAEVAVVAGHGSSDHATLVLTVDR